MAITIPIVSEFDGKGISRAVQEFKQLETAGEKAQFAIKKAAIPAAAALGGLAVAGFSAAKAAMEDEKSAAELARTLKTSTRATENQVKATEDMISSMTLATGVADTDLRNALATLARGMGSTELASQNLQLAMDISAATGKDLTTVSEALSKAYNGQTTALSKLDPSMRGLVKEGASFNEIGQIMAETFGGAAATAAETAEGRFKRMQTAIGETQESIGAALLPIIEKLLPYLEDMAKWVSENTDLIVTIGVVVGGFAAGIIALNAALKAWEVISKAATVAQTAFNLAMSANPIVLATAAIVAIGAAVVLAYKKFEPFRDIVDSIGQTLKTAFTATVDAIKVGLNAYVNIYKSLFNLIAKAWNMTIGGFGFEVPSWVPGLGGKGFKIPEIPMLAAGGIVTAPTLAVVGEAGPEAVIPLDRLGQMGMGGGVTINVHGGDPESVVDALRRYMRTNGSVPIRVGNAY
jgi:pimeloyl-ACP methyl ester carboxylesterase